MRVLLVTAAGSGGSERWMPMGMLYLASMLQKHGHEARICDKHLIASRLGRGRSGEEMLAAVRSFQPELVGFNTVSPLIYDTVESVRLLRDSGYSGRILLGGHHATALPELTLRRIPGADAIIAGEGEFPLALAACGVPNARIPALYWREGSEILHTPPATVCQLDALPLPAYHLLDGWYTGRNAYTIRGHCLRVGSVLASRGCLNRCAFCTESLTYARGVRHHSAEYVADNIELLNRKFGCDGVTFFDNDFLAVRNRSEEILRRLISKGLNRKVGLCIQSRVDGFDGDMAKLLKEAGCVKVEFGFETISPETLKGVGKNASMEDGERAARTCREHGLGFQANMMAGLEGDGLERVDATLAWLKDIGAENIKWGMLMLLPGTQLYGEKGGGFFEGNEWTEKNITGFYSTDHLSGLGGSKLLDYIRFRLAPYARRLHHRTIWRKNPAYRAAGYYIKRLAEKTLEGMHGKSQGAKGIH